MGWIIEVCSTCGREAKWPFCAHRPEFPQGHKDRKPWCETIHVAPTSKRGRELAAINSAYPQTIQKREAHR